MTRPLSPDRQRSVLHQLRRLFADRAEAERAARDALASAQSAAERDYAQSRQRIDSRRSQEREAVLQKFQAVIDAAEAQHAAATEAALASYNQQRHTLLGRFQVDEQTLKEQHQEALLTITALNESSRKRAATKRQKLLYALVLRTKKMDAIRAEARTLVDARGLLPATESVPVPEGELAVSADGEPPPPLEAMRLRVATANAHLKCLRSLVPWPKFVRFCIIGMLTAIAATWALLAWGKGWHPGVLAAGPVLALLAGLALAIWRTVQTRRLVAQHFGPLLAELDAAQHLKVVLEQKVEQEYERRMKRARRWLKKATAKTNNSFLPRLEWLTKQHERDQQTTQAEYQRATEQFDRERAAVRKEAALHRDQQLAELTERHQKEVAELDARKARQLTLAQTTYDHAFAELSAAWEAGLAAAQDDWADMDRDAARFFGDWNDPDFALSQQVPSGMRFGSMIVDLTEFPGGVPTDRRLSRPDPLQRPMPALLAFPKHASLLLKVADLGRHAAVQTLQTIMLRLLTALPPGKVRFTVVDPVGLGENFAAFMHLADYDEQLIASRIWTETPQIEKRLADLTAHMENVIQKYLRNQYASIEDYNQMAGEVAEPYRVLVVANFPVNFSAEAARRLLSIASSGASCGVYTLVSVDTAQPLPQGFKLADLEAVSTLLLWKDGRFSWKDEEFSRYPLTLDAPPDGSRLTQLLHQVGAKARDAQRVEVRFDFIAPAPDAWWTGTTRFGIDVPLGRAGATKRQHLRLGQGTAQHALVAGKTGSGKSTLLHALITNLALIYPPDEIELYLIDFKKGVEFKVYATHTLPHARVVAVESEREFGLSVLQRLDAELRWRGEKFRQQGVNDLPSYRAATPEPLPRLFLIVDEFQEFFIEDDKLAQEAALLLDRLVRQGRAFGLHVLLGSQTLGGAYSLARSTIDQMAVRIALQCSETDANLILSKDNAAARLLSRPGEAIYNDANGLLEGNDIFQVVWLPEDHREELLLALKQKAAQQRPAREAPLVFEGNQPAEIARNATLCRWLDEGPSDGDRRRGLRVWLGEAVAIKEPTSVDFRRQSGSNLLLVGQQSQAALGVLTHAVLTLATQIPVPTERVPIFTILEAMPSDDPNVGFRDRLRDVLPHPLRLPDWRDLGAALDDLAGEVERRQKDRDADGLPLFLVIDGLQRFRELRKADDDFSFGRRGAEATVSPAKRLAAILRDGPAVGVHVLTWCDSLNNLQRFLERQQLREFELRALFQMSVADSSNLIDSPAASKLGPHRALFLSEQTAQPEKFRPYRLPDRDWLRRVGESLHRRCEPLPTSPLSE